MKKILLSILALLPMAILAQEFKVDGVIRPRYESKQGYKTLRPEVGDYGNNAVQQRSRLNMFYASKNKNIKLKVSLQDIRTWGTTKQLVNDPNSLGVHEAWAEVNLASAFSAKVGRQELVYDNSRMLGNVGWAQQARTHDVALLKYKGNVEIHAAFAIAPTAPELRPMSYQGFQFIWLNKKTDNLNLSFLFLNNGKQQPTSSIEYSQTLGTFIKYKSGSFGLAGQAYYQMGKDGSDKDLSAYDAMLEASFKASEKITFTLGGEILSGTDQDADATENKSFTPFYGTNHKFNGLMDYFYVGNHANSVGLTDLYAKVGYKKGPFKAGISAHMLSASAKMVNMATNTEVDSNLGTEIDITAGYKFSKSVALAAGVSTMFATENMEHLKGGDSEKTGVWSWVMLTINPNLFSSKK